MLDSPHQVVYVFILSLSEVNNITLLKANLK